MYNLKILTLLVLGAPVIASAGEKADWPCYHGPKRNNLATDTGLMQAWPDEGPTLLWTNSDIGHGYSTAAIAGGRIFTAGMIDKQTYVTALDAAGKKLWQRLNGKSWQASERQSWAVPHRNCIGETGALTGSCPPLPIPPRDPKQAVFPQLGEGPDVSG
jgi:hypothetical protein